MIFGDFVVGMLLWDWLLHMQARHALCGLWDVRSCGFLVSLAIGSFVLVVVTGCCIVLFLDDALFAQK